MEQIDIHKVKELLDSNNVVIVDIRDQGSFDEAHIQNAVHVQNDNAEEFVTKADKDKPLICYCYHGISSQNAAAYFENVGFKTVYSMLGGFESWSGTYPSISTNEAGG